MCENAVKTSPDPKGDMLMSPHIRRLNVLNVVFVAVFAASAYFLAQSTSSLRTYSADALKEHALPLIGCVASLTYFFGFFGVSIISSLMEEDCSTEAAPKPKNFKYTTPYDVIVVGAGTAGAALANTLGDQGRKVLLVERDLAVQDRIVGELLQPGGLRALERMGLAECATAASADSVRVDGYTVILPADPAAGRPEEEILLRYPDADPATLREQFGVVRTAAGGRAEQAGAAPKGRSFHNGKFVDGLRRAALAHPNVTVVEGTVTKLLEDLQAPDRVIGVRYTATAAAAAAAAGAGGGGGAAAGGAGEGGTRERRRSLVEPVAGLLRRLGSRTELDRSGGGAPGAAAAAAAGAGEKVTREALAPLTVVADGIWSGLRAKIADVKGDVRKSSSFAGLVVRHRPMEAPVPHRHYGHVVLARPSPVLIYQIGAEETRVLVDVHGPLPSQHDGSLQKYFKEEVAPQLPEQFRGPFAAAVDREEIKAMPNRTLPAKATRRAGVLAVGDALNMRHPLTGGGMTVGLRDVELLTRLLRGVDLSDARRVQKINLQFQRQRKAYAATINVLADALHSVFSTPGGDATRLALREACFTYLKMGGAYAAGPIGLLSGLTPRPGVLVAHFFMVAFHGVKGMLLPYPTPGRCLKTYALLHVACRIILPLLAEQRATALASWPLRKTLHLLFPWEGRAL